MSRAEDWITAKAHLSWFLSPTAVGELWGDNPPFLVDMAVYGVGYVLRAVLGWPPRLCCDDPDYHEDREDLRDAARALADGCKSIPLREFMRGN